MLMNELDKVGHARVHRRVTLEGTSVAPGHDSNDLAAVHQWTTGITLAGVDSGIAGTQMVRQDRAKVLVRLAADHVVHDRHRNLLQVIGAGSLVL